MSQVPPAAANQAAVARLPRSWRQALARMCSRCLPFVLGAVNIGLAFVVAVVTNDNRLKVRK
jgi:hypothetical protein